MATQAVRSFRKPGQWAANLNAETAASLLAHSADIALVIDRKGVILDVAYDSEEWPENRCNRWVGRDWTQTVTADSKIKVSDLLHNPGARPRWRQVNHPSARGADIPVQYSTMRIGDEGPVVAVGRDLSGVAQLQQRLVTAQQSLERDYASVRQVETKYRALFHLSSEAIMIVNSRNGIVADLNPAAERLLGTTAARTRGSRFPRGFDRAGTEALRQMLDQVRVSGRADEVSARVAGGDREFRVSASLFRQQQAAFALIRLVEASPRSAERERTRRHSGLLELVERSPDGFVVSDVEGRILLGNRAFIDMVQLVTENQVLNESLDRWLGRTGVDLRVLKASLHRSECVQLYATTITGEYGVRIHVELSAVSVPGGALPCLGFVIRNVDRRLRPATDSALELPSSVEQLTELVGRVSLKQIVRESTDVIEKLCIEAALDVTGDNRASAAELLGLSRQSLYSKLRRYGPPGSGDKRSGR